MSKALPAHLRERYEETISDPELLDLTAEIRLVDTFLEDALSRIGTGDSPDRWTQLNDLVVAYEEGDSTDLLSLMIRIQKLARSGNAEATAQAEVLRLLQMRRRLTESENRRRINIGAMITVSQALAFMTACVASVERHVQDRSTLAAVIADLDRLADQSGDRSLPAP
jgi:hypothetical protein